MNFIDKLERAIAQNNTLLILALDPNPEMIPQGEKVEDWLALIIEKTQDKVCAYKPTLGFYQAMGESGFALLQNILQLIPARIPIILDAKHGDLNTSTLVAKTVFEKWGIDGITINPLSGQDQAAPFLLHPDKTVFVTCRTSNPTASMIQDYPHATSPLYLELVREAQKWGTSEQVALEIGTNDANILRTVRQNAPERLILSRSLWNSTEIAPLIAAGLNHHGSGLLIPVPQDFLRQETLEDSMIDLNQNINAIRQDVAKKDQICQIWTSDVCFLTDHPHQDLILQLYDLDCILFGDYIQASGEKFPYYIDLRKIISQPQIFQQVLNAYSEILQTLTFDRIAGIPYGALPTATGLSLRLHHPMIYPRKEVKAHGTRRVIEGHFELGETVVVIDDILISGKSAIEGAEKIESQGLNVEDIVVFIDHEKGVKDRLKAKGYNAHSVLKISEINQTLYEAGRISPEQYKLLTHE
ncbi:Orotidine-5'-phosphate decarboxylase, Orotate phosphoribosyltransferase [Halothece sp. PCC 7418]|uniref:bifunctional orotidine-5'-phosphate decarboxylase/orotate phosphoribosyltransferase n=1 Tax=Halothece sp. (strain PCC 7418) TaxID=65093 RepID=UPI0002A06F3B|nr:bifunctional orotidine-5'-phosphate decarboxylase/orotate phosphoribosyltransferase [Halothece sp. PCC 7418]AFZ44734.1 Orotidine-5'-phosphate decarboxylase, Orotate phosphoribosyltransferase [Halothece sp. PCC 7418]